MGPRSDRGSRTQTVRRGVLVSRNGDGVCTSGVSFGGGRSGSFGLCFVYRFIRSPVRRQDFMAGFGLFWSAAVAGFSAFGGSNQHSLGRTQGGRCHGLSSAGSADSIHAYIHACMHACAYMRICIHAYIRLYVRMYVCACMHVCMYACVCVHVCTCMYVCVHVCMYACYMQLCCTALPLTD